MAVENFNFDGFNLTTMSSTVSDNNINVVSKNDTNNGSIQNEKAIFLFGDVYLMGYVPSWVPIVYIIFNILIFVFGVSGNLVIIIIYHKTVPKIPCDWFILFIAYMDLIVCACHPWLNLRVELEWYILWDFQGVICGVETLINFSAMLSSCFLLGLMAFERYIKVCRPTVASLTGDTAKLISYGAIALSVLLCLYPSSFHVMASECAIYKHLGGIPKVYMLGIFGIFCACFITVTVSYANVIRTIELKIKVKQRLLSHNGLHDENNVKGKNKDDDEVCCRSSKSNFNCLSYIHKLCDCGRSGNQRKQSNIRIEIDEIESSKSKDNKKCDEKYENNLTDMNRLSPKLNNKTKFQHSDRAQLRNKEDEQDGTMDVKQLANLPSIEADSLSVVDGREAITQLDHDNSSEPVVLADKTSDIITLESNGVSVISDNTRITDDDKVVDKRREKTSSKNVNDTMHNFKINRQGDLVNIVSRSEENNLQNLSNINTTESNSVKTNKEISAHAWALDEDLHAVSCGNIVRSNSSNGQHNRENSIWKRNLSSSTSPNDIECLGGGDNSNIETENLIQDTNHTDETFKSNEANHKNSKPKDWSVENVKDVPAKTKKDHLKLKLQRSDDSYFVDDDLYSDVQPVSFFLRRAKEKVHNLQDKLVKKKCHSSCHRRTKWVKERRMTLMLFSITFIFLISWIPPWSLYLCFLLNHQPFESHLVIRMAYRYWEKMTLLQYCSNCIIYYTFNPGFRKKMKKLMAFVWERICCNHSNLDQPKPCEL